MRKSQSQPLPSSLQLLDISTTSWHGEKLPWIKQLVRIPGFTHLLHHAKIDLAENESHFLLFLNSHSMLSSDCASYLGTNCKYVMSSFTHAFDFPWILGVKKNKWV